MLVVVCHSKATYLHSPSFTVVELFWVIQYYTYKRKKVQNEYPLMDDLLDQWIK